MTDDLWNGVMAEYGMRRGKTACLIRECLLAVRDEVDTRVLLKVGRTGDLFLNRLEVLGKVLNVVTERGEGWVKIGATTFLVKEGLPHDETWEAH